MRQKKILFISLLFLAQSFIEIHCQSVLIIFTNSLGASFRFYKDLSSTTTKALVAQRLTKILMQCRARLPPPRRRLRFFLPLGLTPIDKNLFVAEVNDPSNLTRSHMPPRHQQSFFPLLVGSLTFLSLRLSSRLYYTLTTYNICKVYLFTFQILLIALSSLRRTLLSILNEGRFFFKELTRSPTYMVNWHHCAGSEPQRTDRIKLII